MFESVVICFQILKTIFDIHSNANFNGQQKVVICFQILKTIFDIHSSGKHLNLYTGCDLLSDFKNDL